MLLDDTDGLCHRLLISCDSDAAAGFPSTSCIHLAARNGHTAIVRLVVYELCELSECTFTDCNEPRSCEYTMNRQSAW